MVKTEKKIQLVEIQIASKTPEEPVKVRDLQVTATGTGQILTERILFQAQFANGEYLELDYPQVNTGIVIQDGNDPAVIITQKEPQRLGELSPDWDQDQVWD